MSSHAIILPDSDGGGGGTCMWTTVSSFLRFDRATQHEEHEESGSRETYIQSRAFSHHSLQPDAHTFNHGQEDCAHYRTVTGCSCSTTDRQGATCEEACDDCDNRNMSAQSTGLILDGKWSSRVFHFFSW